MSKSNLMTPTEALLVVAKSSQEGELKGRTRVQKLIYFLAQHFPIPVTYTPYYYGPYSEEVAASLDSLVAGGLFDEEIQYIGNTEGPFEGRLYRYRLTEGGSEVADSLLERRGDLQELRERARAILNLNPTTATLAVASKLHYISRHSKDRVGTADLRTEASRFGWNIDESQVQEAIQFLKQVE